MAAKLFEVGDVLPATTQLRISWENQSFPGGDSNYRILTNNNNNNFIHVWDDFPNSVVITIITNTGQSTAVNGIADKYYIIDTSTWSESDRTISAVNTFYDGGIFFNGFTYEDVASVGYSITFVENGGSTVTDLTEQTALPTPLPTTTKANHIFAGWYYDNLFTQKANAGDELTANVTLYAKWYTPTTWCEDIADAIREKDGTTEPIKHLDFPDRIRALESGIDVSDANAVVGEVLAGKTFYAVDDTKKTGTMPNRGTVSTDITTKAQEVTIQQGYHSGSGKVKISTTEQAKIIASNIKSGVTILGQAGAVTPAKEEQEKTISPTTSSQDVLPDSGKVLSKVTVNAIPTETKSQQPSLGSGNQTINATSGKFMTSFTITKDAINHIASNIRSGITLYGVTGNLQPAKEEETQTVTPDFSSGNVVVTPTTGKVLSQVTINKDGNLIADNIKKDVTVHGITGTLESGGGTSLDRIGMICFSVSVSKTDSTAQTLKYWTNSNMLSKTFFTDGEGNWYLPEDVKVYFDGSNIGDADTVLTLFNGTGTFFSKPVTFKVGTTPVALLLYYYYDTGYDSNGLISIYWTSGTGAIFPNPNQTEFIELPSNFFDDFPYYSSSDVYYWNKENFFHFFKQGRVGYSSVRLESGWYLETFD